MSRTPRKDLIGTFAAIVTNGKFVSSMLKPAYLGRWKIDSSRGWRVSFRWGARHQV